MLSARGVQLVFLTMYICAGITKSIHQTYVRTVVSACCKKVLRVETTVKSEVTAEMTRQSFYKQMLGEKKKASLPLVHTQGFSSVSVLLMMQSER